MLLEIVNEYVPGSTVKRKDAGGITGLAFIERNIIGKGGIRLSAIREITGIDSTTLQNWTKRGWVSPPVRKMYDADRLASILIINMIRDTMRLDRIVALLSYVNGREYDKSDNPIGNAEIYDLICRVISRADQSAMPLSRERIARITAAENSGRTEYIPGSVQRMNRVTEIIVTAYYASILKKDADGALTSLSGK